MLELPQRLALISRTESHTGCIARRRFQATAIEHSDTIDECLTSIWVVLVRNAQCFVHHVQRMPRVLNGCCSGSRSILLGKDIVGCRASAGPKREPRAVAPVQRRPADTVAMGAPASRPEPRSPVPSP
jgi:hypothetical protein